MDLEHKIAALQAKVEALGSDLEKSNEAIARLQQEIAALKQKRMPDSSVPKTNSFTLENFVGLKLVHFVGIIVLITGLSIGVKYAIDINLISPALRIILAYVASAALFLLSLKLRKKYELFSVILLSGAMASAYFTSYAAFAYYGMLPRLVTFIMMLLLTIFTVYNALKYDRMEIAILGLVGAYGIPFFVKGDSENITGLLSYILLINLGILSLSFKKYWQSLNYIAFLTSWTIYFSCMYVDEAHRFYESSLLFAFAFYLLFTISIPAFNLYRKKDLQPDDSIMVVMNAAMLYIALHILMLIKDSDPRGTVTLIFAVVYFVAALLSGKFLRQQLQLSNALFLIAIFSLVAYFPLEFDGFPITIIWVIIAVVLFVAGMYFRMKLFRLVAMVLFALTLLKLLFYDSTQFTSLQKVIAYVFTGTVLLVVSFLYQRYKERIV